MITGAMTERTAPGTEVKLQAVMEVSPFAPTHLMPRYIVEEGYLEFLTQTYAAKLRAGRRQDIDENKNERVEVEESWRAMEVAGMEGEAADDNGEYGIDGGDGGSP